MDPQFLRELALGALLHDIGKIAVSDQILHKPGRLDENEFALMRRHTVLGARFIERFPHLADALPVVRSHHEKWDGTGYPDCLAGAEIPIAARIFSVLDAFDAMVTNRSYQNARSYVEVCDEICTHSGTQFDPDVVRGFSIVPEAEWDLIRLGNVKWVAEAVQTVLAAQRRSA
jgi:cyclic di-GMP phosphodiesterase